MLVLLSSKEKTRLPQNTNKGCIKRKIAIEDKKNNGTIESEASEASDAE